MDERKRWIAWLGAGLMCGVAWAGEPTGGSGVDPLEQGRTWSRAGEHARAAEAFTRVLQGKDAGPERRLGALEGRCEALTRQSLHEKRGELALQAVEDCSERLRLESGSARIWRLRGLARLAAGQPEQALINFNHALRLAPDDWMTLRDRGVVLLGLGRMAEAEGDFQRVARLDPDQAWNHFNRGVVLARNGRVAEAAEAWREFVRVRGKNAREWLAQMVARPGGDPEARKVFEAMERADPVGESVVSAGSTPSPPATLAVSSPGPGVPAVKEPPGGSVPGSGALAVKEPPGGSVTGPGALAVKEPPGGSVTGPGALAVKEPPGVSSSATPSSAPTVAETPPVALPSAAAVAEGAGRNKSPAGGATVPAAAGKGALSLPASANGYEVRFGSFQERSNLEATLRSLNGLGVTVREEEVMVGERHFYRLVAGPFDESETRAVVEKASRVPGVHPEPVRAR
ncbi:MAG: tetratricopeptide repeat protein [Magnetococcales bacterium]|nr:tetratricopeptide repeat protein [Magnetococcales bacterium]